MLAILFCKRHLGFLTSCCLASCFLHASGCFRTQMPDLMSACHFLTSSLGSGGLTNSPVTFCTNVFFSPNISNVRFVIRLGRRQGHCAICDKPRVLDLTKLAVDLKPRVAHLLRCRSVRPNKIKLQCAPPRCSGPSDASESLQAEYQDHTRPR